ncbi:MAG: FtsX-like permease family protein [Bacteroidales bacterium]|jgi:putative ABC transport system permease protein|nr:FtsX-like permease family protein [Bacteroidales bacterium]
MKRFLLKGIINDKGRSLLPIIVVATGTMLTVLLYSWLTGVMGESIRVNANFNTGELKVMTLAYSKDSDQFPNDLAILDASLLINDLKEFEPTVDWVKRVRFGALADFPDSLGETRGQAPVIGWAIDIFSKESLESQRFNLESSIVNGEMPKRAGEVLISNELATKFNVQPGESFTLFGSTMEGGFAFYNLKVSGTLLFGASGLDRGAIVMDIEDAQRAFGMEDACGEILGFLPDKYLNMDNAERIKVRFNNLYSQQQSTDEFAPVMITLRDQAGMAEMVDYTDAVSSIMVFIFVSAMAIVLWNGGLLGALRRYSEFGIRLAMGESKGHIYRSLLTEALIIGAIGSLIGTIIGFFIVLYINVHGVDMSSMMQNSTMVMPSVVRTAITPTTYYIGFIPGIFSMVLGNALAGLGIYKRQTARLFNELEV